MRYSIRSINPHTRKETTSYSVGGKTDALNHVKLSKEAFNKWKETPVTTRAEYMNKIADILRERKEEFGRIITSEMGKPISQAIGEIEKCAWLAEYYAQEGPGFLKDVSIKTDMTKSIVSYAPIGVVLQLAPFNFPFWQVIRFAIPAMISGNTTIIRHSHGTPMSAASIQKVFEEAGLPQGALQSVFIDHDSTWNILEDEAVQGVSVTGGTQVGAMAAEHAGRNIKRSVLELGGNDPFIVLKDADLENAVKNAVTARIINNGQSCIAAKRFIVEEPISDQFTKEFASQFYHLKMGDPMSPDTQLGPLAREDLRDKVADQVHRAVDAGAEVICGGKIPERDGWYYLPTVLRMNPDNPLLREEIFGPVASVISARDVDDAVNIANDSQYGLGSSVFTADTTQGESIARKLNTGMAFVNTFTRSDPRLPFGGFKESGYGRECARDGVMEWVNTRTICIN